MKLFTATLWGEAHARKLVEELARLSQWFQFQPLPDDAYQVAVKVENRRWLEHWIKEAGADRQPERHECDNCRNSFVATDLKETRDYSQRVDPGGTVPSGECPDCGALCYPARPSEDLVAVRLVSGHPYSTWWVEVDAWVKKEPTKLYAALRGIGFAEAEWGPLPPLDGIQVRTFVKDGTDLFASWKPTEAKANITEVLRVLEGFGFGRVESGRLVPGAPDQGNRIVVEVRPGPPTGATPSLERPRDDQGPEQGIAVLATALKDRTAGRRH